MNLSNPKRILLVGDLTGLAPSLRDDLAKQGIDLSVSTSLVHAREALVVHGLPDGLLINLNGLADDGLAFCGEMNQYPGLPVIVLSPEDSSAETALAAFACADGYLRPDETQPAEIASRFVRLLDRMSATVQGVGREIQLRQHVRVDFVGGVVSIAGRASELTPTEVALLHVLLTHSNESVDATTLIERVWRGSAEGNPNSLRVHMHRLRKKLGWKKRDQAALIDTVRGTGYILRTDE